MESYKSEVYSILNSIEELKQVSADYPKDFKHLPAVAYYESSNTPLSMADDEEYETDASYQIDLYCKGSTTNLAKIIDNKMTENGFFRELGINAPEPSDIKHYTARYSKII